MAGFFATALALRPQIVAIGPLVPEIQHDLGLSHAEAGLLVAIPVVAMGASAFPAPSVRARLGSRAAIATCLAVLALFGVGRAAAPDGVALLAVTVPVGAGLGLAGALLPGAVKERLPHRPAFATGVYVLGLTVGAAAAGGLAVPLARVAGGWRGSLALFSLATAGLLAVWLRATRGDAPDVSGRAARPAIPFRSGLGWLLALAAALNASVFYGIVAWLPDVYVERGWGKGAAGLLIGVANAAAAPALLVIWWADRRGSRRAYLVASALAMAGALVGVILLPGAGWLMAALFGAGNTIFFSLILTLPLDLGSRPDQVGATTALMLGAGYGCAGSTPFVLGALRDATGGFAVPLWLLAAAAGALVPISLRLTGRRVGARSRPELA